MTNEQKQLLFKDLCGRLPYNVLVKSKKYSFPIELRYLTLDKLPDVKPYLRPMSAMTQEEKKEYYRFYDLLNNENFELYKQIDWLNANHFDFRGLIPMGLAIEAPEGMYNF